MQEKQKVPKQVVHNAEQDWKNMTTKSKLRRNL